MPVYLRTLASVLVILGVAAAAGAQGRDILPPAPTPTDIKPGSITCDECPYPAPSKYLDINVYSQDVRISYMDIAPTGTANGHVVLLMHGNNFGGFYFGDIIDGLTDVGFSVVVPDQIGYGKSSKPIAPYNFNTQARTRSSSSSTRGSTRSWRSATRWAACSPRGSPRSIPTQSSG